MAGDEAEQFRQGVSGAGSSDEGSGAKESELRRQRQRALDGHDRLMASRSADAARDTLHDNAPFQEPGSYTVFEARDRAAHTPSTTREMERQTNMAVKSKSPFSDYERYLLGVQERRDMAEIYPDGHEAQWLRERARLAEVNPQGPEARQIQEEARLAKLHEDGPQGQNNEREVRTEVTPEQKANVDKALAETQLSKIGGASDVGSKPTPNEASPLNKSREIGQDLQRQGVTMDRDK